MVHEVRNGGVLSVAAELHWVMMVSLVGNKKIKKEKNIMFSGFGSYVIMQLNFLL